MRLIRRATICVLAVLIAALPLVAVAPASAAPIDNSACTTWVHGIDVSNNNGSIDWSQVPSSGIAFAYFKISEGTWYSDPYRTANAFGATAAGIPWGGYDFGRPGRTDPIAEADYFIDHGGNSGTLPGALDLEVTGGMSSADVGAWAVAWVNHYYERTGRTPLIYVGAYFAGDVAGLGQYLALWLPSYTAYGHSDPNPCDMRQPVVANGWDGWSIWQYTDAQSINGIYGNVDGNVMAPSVYAALTGVGSVPAPTPTPTEDASWQVYWIGSRGPGVSARQHIVNQAGCGPIAEDGVYGRSTAAGVACLQAKLGLKPDGVWGPQTDEAVSALFVYLNAVAVEEHRVAAYLYAISSSNHRVAAYLHSVAAGQSSGQERTDHLVAAYLHTVAADNDAVASYLHSVAAEQ